MMESIINYFFYQPAQILKPLRFASPLGWMIEAGKQLEFHTWTAPSQYAFYCLGAGCLLNEVIYLSSEQNPDVIPEAMHTIHGLQKLLTLAFLVKSLIQGYRSGSWDQALLNAGYQIPALAACLFPNPTSSYEIPNPTFSYEMKQVTPSTTKDALYQERNECYRSYTETILATALIQNEKSKMILIAPHTEVQKFVIQSLSDLIEEKQKNIPIYNIDVSKILNPDARFGKIASSMQNESAIFVVQGIDSLIPNIELDNMNPLNQFIIEIVSQLQSQDARMILELRPETYQQFLKLAPNTIKNFPSFQLSALPLPLKKNYFQAISQASEDQWEKISGHLGEMAPLDDHLLIMNQAKELMNFNQKSFDESLEQLKETHLQTSHIMPPNLTELTALNENVICLEREEDLKTMVVTLNSKSGKNNVCLSGEAGCGKTQLVHYFAMQIKEGAYNHCFKGAHVFGLTLSSIIAGSTYTGAWQAKLKAIFEFLKPLYATKGEDVFLFIDEIHMVIGSGKSEGSETMDIANMLKEYLLHPKLRIIGATTPTEYRQYLAHDTALMDRFTPQSLSPLTPENQMAALRAHSSKFSADQTPLPDENLKCLLNNGQSLRSAEGTLGRIHSYKELYPNASTKEATNWVLNSANQRTPTRREFV